MRHLIKAALKKAEQSECRYRISAIGLNKRGEVIAKTVNQHRFDRQGGGLHAEMLLMRKTGSALKTIIICRIGNSGEIRPIEPCSICAEKAAELGIKIITVWSEDEKVQRRTQRFS
jgi:tRNA(Arg) A34 adenosine deaminase TadA